MPIGAGSLIVGTDIQYDGLEASEYLSSEREIRRAQADIERWTTGIYLFGQQPLGGGFELSGGLRGERAETDNRYIRYKEEQLRPELETNRGTIPNPFYKSPPDADPLLSFDGPVRKSGWAAEVSLVRVVSETVSIWAGWDRVYRYPSLDEAASYQGYPLSTPLNAELDPETGNNFELGIKRSGTLWHSGLTAFLMLLDDEIAFDEDEEKQIKINRNIGDTRRYGLEFDAAYETEQAGASTRVALTRAEFLRTSLVEYGDQLPLVPELQVDFSAWVRIVPSLRLAVYWQYLSSQVQGNDYSNTRREIPGYSMTNLSLLWDVKENLSFSIRVNNITDKNYIATAYNGGFYPGAGREILMGVRAVF
jgi:outer membrane receptor protein involved in Fe transport